MVCRKHLTATGLGTILRVEQLEPTAATVAR